MCGRYYIEIGDEELEEIIREAENKLKEYPGQISMKTSGEIFPTDIVPVQTGLRLYQPMKWGFSNYKGALVINARSETAYEKAMFRGSMLERRCLIPASGYYEWQKKEGTKNKVKHQFFMPGETMFFAGCFRLEKDSLIPRFVILTRDASDEIAPIHDRMPVILPQSGAVSWLHGDMDVLAKAVTRLISVSRVSAP